MNSHEIFYYPYASFKEGQMPLLKAAALYFDKLYILDPRKASSGTTGIQHKSGERGYIFNLEGLYKGAHYERYRPKVLAV